MKKIDCVLENKKEEIKELLIGEFCPCDFKLSDIEEGCDVKNCSKCWNEEMEDEE